MLSDITTIDYANYLLRFLVVYNVISYVFNNRLLLKTLLNTDLIIDTITKLYISSNWYERECWDLYGINFLNNMDLRRILNDYGFLGHPFRKDFPLIGFFEPSLNSRLEILINNYIKMTQEFRFYSRNTPWKSWS